MTTHKQLGELFRSEAPRLERYLRRFGAGVSPEDICQESFAKLCSLNFAELDSPRAYLFRTARNLALNTLRRSRWAPLDVVASPGAFEARTADPSPEDDLLTNDALRRLNAALDLLPPHKREALLLFRVEGWSQREIGAKLGVSHRTVERYVADAVAHCHLILCSEPPEDTSASDC